MDEEKPEIYTRILRSAKRRKTDVDNYNNDEASQAKDRKVSGSTNTVGDDISFQTFPQLSINITPISPLVELQDKRATPSSSSLLKIADDDDNSNANNTAPKSRPKRFSFYRSIRPKLIKTKKSLGIGTTSAAATSAAATDIANLGIFDELKENSCEDIRTEDLYNIYYNKLWQSQIPVNKKLETIWEDEADVKRPKRTAFRFISFKNVVSRKKKLMRRTKAVNNGWKVVTQKRLLELEEDLKKFLESDIS